MFDASEPITPADEDHLAEFRAKKRILIRNKTDLPIKLVLPGIPHPEPAGTSSVTQTQSGLRIVDVCCLTGQGLETLKDTIKELVWSGGIQNDMLQVMINSRHQEALERARTAAVRTVAALRAGETLELAALDLRIAVNAVGEIVGKTGTEDLLDVIFSQFCIGK